MIKVIQFLMLFLGLSFAAFAQKSQVSGVVYDTNDQPLPLAELILKNTVRAVQSNSKGEYKFTALKAGDYIIIASYAGFQTEEKSVTLTENHAQTLDFHLVEKAYSLSDVEVTASRGVLGNERMGDVEGYSIIASKKNEVIKLENIDANLAMNNARQTFGRIPGISIWENDGSGIQLGIASRGLSPNRSWDFLVRMNGYDITPDPLGYPEAYYTPPMEVVDRIEIIRGASSLQYGPHFGGLLNFILRKPDASTRFTVESQNTVGSNGLFSTFNYVGGTKGRGSYTAYFQKRRGDGWRENTFFNTGHAHAEASFAVSNRLKIGVELTYMGIKSQQAGGLTDSLFTLNARRSNRERNWFSTPWLMPSFNAEYVFNKQMKMRFKANGTFAERSSLGFLKAANLSDDFQNRQLDRDYYKNLTSELRLLFDYRVGKKNFTLATGLRYFTSNIQRQQLGKGSAGSDLDLNLAPNTRYPRDLDFDNANIATFAENIFRISKRLLITAGLRVEKIKSTIQGRFHISNGIDVNLTPTTRTRTFALFGGGLEFRTSATTELYSNLSQAYRPILISDLTPPATTDVISEKLQDARGFNFDFGFRGKLGNYLNFDVDYFYLNYDNRIGTITQTDTNGQHYQLRTNLGQSVNQGFEAYIEFDPFAAFFKNARFGSLSLFASSAYVDARYCNFKTTFVVNNEIVEGNLKDKRVENAPRNINRFGITYRKKGLSFTYQVSQIGMVFADALNTEKPNAAATTGKIPGYTVQDFSAGFKFLKHYNLKAGINNLGDVRYFTRRAGGYPGPGLMPADGRTFYVSGGVKF